MSVFMGSVQLNVACFVVQSCLTDADFVISSNYCLIGTRLMAFFFLFPHNQPIGINDML